VGGCFIERFEHLTLNYRDLLFNAGTLERAKNRGFVSLSEKLHANWKVSANLI
jgi:hypothetical protein